MSFTLDSEREKRRVIFGGGGGWSSGGRGFRVYGCSPGCLLMSLLLSVGLTVLVNLLLWAIGASHFGSH